MIAKNFKPEMLQVFAVSHDMLWLFYSGSADAAFWAGTVNHITRVYALLCQCSTDSVPEFVLYHGRVLVKEAVAGDELTDLRT